MPSARGYKRTWLDAAVTVALAAGCAWTAAVLAQDLVASRLARALVTGGIVIGLMLPLLTAWYMIRLRRHGQHVTGYHERSDQELR